MTFISWQHDYRVGVPLIDSEHEYLFGLVNAFHDSCAGGGTLRQITLVLNRLVAYAEEHFQHEEGLMEEAGYPRLQQHISKRPANRLDAQRDNSVYWCWPAHCDFFFGAPTHDSTPTI